MLCKDLSKEELFVIELVKASRDHGSKLKMETKREFDREASHFFNHLKKLDDSLNSSLISGKDVIVITEHRGVVNVVIKFRDSPFTNMKQLDLQIKKRLKVVEEVFEHKIAFSVLGATPNLDKRKDGSAQNTVVAVAQFVENCKVRNFAITI